MFYLVQWISQKTISIVEEFEVVKIMKDYAIISWNNKTYKAKILAINGK